jgi:hypothetical protein
MLLRPLVPFFAALLLAGPAGAIAAADDISPAERKVFMDAHLDNLPASAELSYGFRTSESGATTLDDSVTLSTRKDGDRGRVVNVDYLHGEHHLELPAVDHAQSNPVILYFLEHDVRDMHRRLGGQENYFRRRIRLAFAEAARMRPVNIRYAGRQVQATEVSVQPYADDPLKDRFKGLAGKSYILLLSDQVPGGVYQLRTVVLLDGSSTPKLENVLTLKGPKTGVETR